MKSVLLGDNEYVGPWVMAEAGGEWVPGVGQTLGLLQDEKLIAGVVYESFNGASCSMHVRAVPGTRWATPAFLRMCFAYPFEQLGLKKVIGPVSAANLTARKFDEHLGFVLEAALKDAHPDGDLLIYTMIRSQCRWLNIKVKCNELPQAESPASTRLRSTCAAAGD